MPDSSTASNAIYQSDGSIISGNKIQLISVINTPSSSPFDNLINLQGVIVANNVVNSNNTASQNAGMSSFTHKIPTTAEPLMQVEQECLLVI